MIENVNKQTLMNIAAKYCDRCGAKYLLSDSRIIKESDGITLLMLQCHKCFATHMVTISVEKGLGSRFILNTDLGMDEMNVVEIGKSISTDEVIDVYSFITSSVKNIADISKVTSFSSIKTAQKLVSRNKRVLKK